MRGEHKHSEPRPRASHLRHVLYYGVTMPVCDALMVFADKCRAFRFHAMLDMCLVYAVVIIGWLLPMQEREVGVLNTAGYTAQVGVHHAWQHKAVADGTPQLACPKHRGSPAVGTPGGLLL